MLFFYLIFVRRTFFDILEEHSMAPEKIGLYEPVREIYSKEKAEMMWIDHDENKERIFGSMMGKRKAPKYDFMVAWNRGTKNPALNYMFFYTTKQNFLKFQEKFMSIFDQLFNLCEGLYAYVSEETAKKRKHVPGDLSTRIPGMFWCNYFGRKYVDFFTKEKIQAGDWFKIKSIGEGGLKIFLTKGVDGEIITDTSIEQRAKQYLGIDCFGDRSEYLLNPETYQVKRVPPLDLSDICVRLN